MSSVPRPTLTQLTQPQPLNAALVSVDRPWLDRAGLSASLICAIHCMLSPFLLLLLPAAGTVWAHPAVHWALAVLVVPLALWVLVNGYRKHGNRLTLVAATAGALLILAGLIAPMVYSQPLFHLNMPTLGLFGDATPPVASAGHTDECCPSAVHDQQAGTVAISFPPGGLITLVGSVLLVLAHGANLVACRCFGMNRGGDCGGSACGCPA